MWADDTPDNEQTKKASEGPLAEAVKVDEEWPSLPQSDVALNDLTDQITQPPTMDGTNDNTQMDSGSQATPSTNISPVDALGTGMTRMKKLCLNKSSDSLLDWKRNRNRNTISTKGKH
jgi:hypothetical protein